MSCWLTTYRPRHRGFTLLEVLVSIALTSVVLTSVAVCLHLVFRANGELRSQVTGAAIVPRLARQLRRDAHAATGWQQSDDPPRLILLHDPARKQVEYQLDDRRLIRRVVDGRQVVHQDQFVFPRGTRFAWETRDDELKLVRLRIEKPISREFPDLHQLDVIEAAVGLLPVAPLPNTGNSTGNSTDSSPGPPTSAAETAPATTAAEPPAEPRSPATNQEDRT